MFLGILAAILLTFFSFPRLTNAQIPLFYQLLSAYQPTSLSYYSPTPTISPVPLTITNPPTNPTPLVLGVSTSLPAIGGEGKVITIVVLGDSMIDTLGSGISKLEAALKRLYPDIKFNIINYGVGASNIEYGLYRLTNNYEYLGISYNSLISLNPDIIVIESFAYNNFGNSQSGIDRQWLNLGAITTILKEKLPQSKIVLASSIAPNPIIFGNGSPENKFSALDKIEKTKTIKLYLQNLVNFATSQGFPLADAYTPSLINGDGRKDYISSTDGIHPSISGNEFFCQTLAQTILSNKLIE